MTTALVLCGGAAHGAIEVGLYRALVELGIEFDFIVGTSIGAVNGALIAAGLSPAELAERWRHIRTSDVLDFRRGWLRLLRNAPDLCDGWRTEQFIRRLLPFHTFMHLPRWLAIVATDLMTGEAVVLEWGDLVEAVLASIALPGLLPPRRYRGRWLIDGGAGGQPARPGSLRDGGPSGGRLSLPMHESSRRSPTGGPGRLVPLRVPDDCDPDAAPTRIGRRVSGGHHFGGLSGTGHRPLSTLTGPTNSSSRPIKRPGPNSSSGSGRASPLVEVAVASIPKEVYFRIRLLYPYGYITRPVPAGTPESVLGMGGRSADPASRVPNLPDRRSL